MILRFSPAALAQGATLYVALCLITWLAGRGLVRLLRLRCAGGTAACLAAAALFVCWTLVLGAWVGWRLPVRLLALPLWSMTLALAVLGFWRSKPTFREILPFLLCLSLPPLVMHDRFLDGLTDSARTVPNDGWFYMACGLSVWDRGRPTETDASLVNQFATCHQDHRYISMAYLAYFSPLVRAGDPAHVVGLYQAWTLFLLAAAIYLFWTAAGQSPGFSAANVVLSLVTGWTATVVWGNWLDQAQAMIYAPLLAAVPRLWGVESRSRWLALGLLVAGAVYTYPQCSPYVVGLAALTCLPCLWTERRSWKKWAVGLGVTALTGLLFWLPGVATLGFLFTSFEIMPKAEWLFAGLGQPALQPGAFWGLGGESYAQIPMPGQRLFGCLLSVTALVGLYCLLRRGCWGLAAAAVSVVLVTLGSLLCLGHYYAAFKFLSLGWWFVVAAVVAGAAGLVNWTPRAFRPWCAAGLFAIGVGLNFWPLCGRATFAEMPPDSTTLSDFRCVRQLRRFLPQDGNTILLAVDDWLASEMAVYYLHGRNLSLAAPRGWLGNHLFCRYRETLPPDPLTDVRLVLTGTDQRPVGEHASAGRLVWSAGPYRLWRLAQCLEQPLVFVFLEPAIGWGSAGQQFSYWVGRQPTHLFILAKEDGLLHMQADFYARPGKSTEERVQLLVSDSKGFSERYDMRQGLGELFIPVSAGMNQITLAAPEIPETPSIRSDPSGGILRVGIMNSRLHLLAPLDRRAAVPVAN